MSEQKIEYKIKSRDESHDKSHSKPKDKSEDFDKISKTNHETKCCSTQGQVVALNLFDATSQLRVIVNESASFIPLTAITAFELISDALDEFGLLISKNCLPPKPWTCLLECLLQSLIESQNSNTYEIRAVLRRIKLSIAVLDGCCSEQDNSQDKDCNKQICSTINTILAQVLNLIAASISAIALSINLSSVLGIELKTLSLTISNVAISLVNDGVRACGLYNTSLICVLSNLNQLVNNFVNSNSNGLGNNNVGNAFRPISDVLTKLSVVCLPGLASKSACLGQDLKTAICSLENTISGLLGISLTPVMTGNSAIPIFL